MFEYEPRKTELHSLTGSTRIPDDETRIPLITIPSQSKHYPGADKAAIVTDYFTRPDLTNVDIANKHGILPNSLPRIARECTGKAFLKRSSTQIVLQQSQEWIFILIDSNWSTETIGEMFGTTQQTISTFLKKHGYVYQRNGNEHLWVKQEENDAT